MVGKKKKPQDDPAGWTSKWPKEPGYYWMYEYIVREAEPNLHFVKVWLDVKGQPIYLGSGRMLFKDFIQLALWKKCTPPKRPELI